MSIPRAADTAGSLTLFSGPCDSNSAQQVRACLASTPLPPIPPAVLADCQLIATELISNALHAQADWIDVGLLVHGGQLQLRVHDNSPGVPTPQQPALTDTGGRGLRIIEAVAAAWGYDIQPGDGKTVWARLDLPTPP